MTLVAIPWQPHLFVHPDYLARLQRASTKLGRKIYLGNVRSPTGEYLAAWRTDAGTRYLWDLYRFHGGSPASNPDTGPRTHRRGTGGDLLDYSPAVRAAMLWAGFIAEPGELWHMNLPGATSYPIIPDHVFAPAGSGDTITIDPLGLPTMHRIKPTDDPTGGVYLLTETGSTRLTAQESNLLGGLQTTEPGDLFECSTGELYVLLGAVNRANTEGSVTYSNLAALIAAD